MGENFQYESLSTTMVRTFMPRSRAVIIAWFSTTSLSHRFDSVNLRQPCFYGWGGFLHLAGIVWLGSQYHAMLLWEHVTQKSYHSDVYDDATTAFGDASGMDGIQAFPKIWTFQIFQKDFGNLAMNKCFWSWPFFTQHHEKLIFLLSGCWTKDGRL